uniref:Progestin and adipoQ receptor family member 3 n=1 Tax=Strigamia maritima TaxID=126957 RepID=T1IKM7_STRMM
MTSQRAIRPARETDSDSTAALRWSPATAAAVMSSSLDISLHDYDQAPKFLQGNPFIRHGYRAYLSPQLCVKSMFWWTNETLNIWTHLCGLTFFVLLLLYDATFVMPHYQVSSFDCLVVSVTMFSMFMSTAYHVFGCHSERAYKMWLAWDLTGVSFSIFAIFLSGIYYAFSCFPFWQSVYTVSVACVFGAAVRMAFEPKLLSEEYQWRRLAIYCTWVVYGIVPTVHWIYLSGGLEKPIVQLLLPRVLIMYLICGLAFFFYVSHYPERLCPGILDFVGASHQLWHILIIFAFYWWHNTGLIYIQIRNHYVCT